MPVYLTPGVYYEPVDVGPPPIEPLRTDIAGFVGIAERGPLHRPVRLTSWRQFQTRFGGFIPGGYLAYAVKGFFENGGRTCYIVRVAHTHRTQKGDESVAQKARTTLQRNNTDILVVEAENEGSWGNRLSLRIQHLDTRPKSAEFTLTVLLDGQVQEIFAGLSMKPGNTRYVEDVLNGPRGTSERRDMAGRRSVFVRVVDLVREKEMLSKLPDSSITSGIGAIQLEGGLDSLRTLTVKDFLGNPEPLARDAEKWGLSAFDRVDEVAILAIPDIMIRRPPLPFKAEPLKRPPKDPCSPCPKGVPAVEPIRAQPKALMMELPPEFTREQIFEVHQALVGQCELQRDRVAILDAPSGTGARVLSLAEVREWRSKFDSERGFAALYYPWLKVPDPLRLGNQPLRAIPPSGHVAGVYARTDIEVGTHKAPANEEIFWAEDVMFEVDDAQQGMLNPNHINAIRVFPGRGIRIYGARTVSSNPDWRFINIRRLMSMIEEAVDEAMQWAVFEPNNVALRQAVSMSVSSFLRVLWRDGALAGATAEEAFFVKCDESNNPPEVIDLGRLICDVGVAPTFPAEFVIFRVGKVRDELEITEE